MSLTTAGAESMLNRWATVRGAQRIADVVPMPGNAGLSFGFTLHEAGGAHRRLVIRLAPPGVRRRGNTDVLRQVPLLRELDRLAPFPVAAVHWWGTDADEFGTDAFISELLPGRPLHMTSAALSCPTPQGPVPLLERAVDALAGLHQIPLPEALRNWDTPASASDDIAAAISLLDRSHDDDARALCEPLADRLQESVPEGVAVGLRHGDFQTNNVLFHDGEVSGVVDWELTGIGPQLLDLGWLIMMTDRRCWDPEYAETIRATADPRHLIQRYAQASDTARPEHVEWFTGLACLRFAGIIAYNLRLHREGKRTDAYYEVLARSLPRLVGRGHASCSAAGPTR
jgi:aminoglycoside phosphotransferase (APT) family kinase protein